MTMKIIKSILAAIIMLATPSAANAQFADILNAAKQALGNNSTAGTITDAVVNLLGTEKLTQSKLIGTWTYDEPCVVLDSEGTFNKIGGSVMSSKIEGALTMGLTKAGIKPGMLSVTYKIEGSDIILTFTRTNKTVDVNTKIVAGELQMAMDATKMLTIVNNITSRASAYSAQLKTISSILNNYNGLHLGMKYKKK